MRRRRVSILMGVALAAASSAAPIRIASLHPVVSDIARQMGGDAVVVIDLMPLDSNPHNFYPSPSNLKEASQADMVLAAGKNLEVYLDSFRESLGGVPVFEVGHGVPSLRVTADDVFLCCPTHAHGAIDPHWWHSIQNVRRASGLLADEFSRLRPEQRDAFRSNHDAYAARLDALYRWAKREIAAIPRANRKLTTAHAAFGYLCREMGLRSITVLGLTTEQDAEPGYLKDVIRMLRENRVPAVFPEVNANPKVLESIAREAGVIVAGNLHADMLAADAPTYEAMVRHNITTIVEGLRGSR
ncbi:MAG TPA: metal ABC transporter substrate-binding protein [Kiritimatiellia bacterium]|nr:metal ABC transporter substrate-binding protein [Kiritimatiellia bacterium]HMO97985.1 metal ABC transporter substrate-binding protein [Kiritimatiellia bacterium]HMP95336.1 metal ABC transporter substrate-binding protein [Kiritimatiellia bacterium]